MRGSFFLLLLQSLRNEITSHIRKCKTCYIVRLGEKLDDSSRFIKLYWATLRSLWNGKKNRTSNNELMAVCEIKTIILNIYFVSQCTAINNDSTLPSILNYLINDKLCSLSISSKIILQLIKSFDPNKTHGHDQISLKMLKMCACFNHF